MIDKNQVLEIVKVKGPVLPRDIVRELGGDTFITGAVLSQLVDDKVLKLSNTKIGSSPVYFLDSQKDKLQNLYKYLNFTEKKAYDILSEKKIIRDEAAEPSLRVALRHIKDFAKPLEVNINGKKEIFWKWYLVDNTIAEQKIRTILLGTKPIQRPKTEVVQKEEKTEPKEETQTKIETIKKQETQEIIEQKPNKEIQKSELLQKVRNIFDKKEIEIVDENIIRKNSEIEMTLLIPSPAGKLKYFCKIRDKKKSNDKDLSSAFVEGQMKKLPILYVTTGEITKKAQQKVDEDFSTVSIMYI
jgi:hypothetical protein